jgi:heterodisulfide reductase subunit C
MIDFGFGINTARVINLDRNDLNTANEILDKLPDLRTCIACGSCTATCTAGNLTPFNFRRVHYLVRRGEYDEAYAEMGKCMLCGKCRLVCPRGINTRGVVLAIKHKLGDY